eukprot:SAG11_NODE_35700_length_265_cov_0.927711_1_plen_57_part_10
MINADTLVRMHSALNCDGYAVIDDFLGSDIASAAAKEAAKLVKAAQIGVGPGLKPPP